MSVANANGRSLAAQWYNWTPPLSTADYTADSSLFPTAHAGTSLGGLSETETFTLTDLNNINRSGYTGLRLYVTGGIPTAANSVVFNAFENGFNEPRLSITYVIGTEQEGVLTPTGQLSWTRKVFQSFTGDLDFTGTGSFLRKITRSFDGVLDTAGSILKMVGRTFIGTLLVEGGNADALNAVPFQAGVDYDTVLAEYGFKVESILRSDITAAIPRVSVATESKKRSDFSELDTLGQFSWHHGRGQYTMSDPAAFMDSKLCDTRIAGQVIPAPERHISFLTGGVNADFGAPVVDMVHWDAADLLYAVAGTLFVFNTTTDEWDDVSAADALLTAMDSTPYRMIDFTLPDAPPSRGTTEYLIISRTEPGSTTGLDYIYSDDAGATWTAGPATDHGSKASMFALFRERLVFDVSNSAIVMRADPTDSDVATNILINNLGSGAEPINNLMVLGEMLVVLKTGSAYGVTYNPTADAFETKPLIDYSNVRHRDNGKGAFVHQGALWFNLGAAVYQFSGTSLRSVGPDLGAHEGSVAVADITGVIQVPPAAPTSQGLLEPKRGTIVSMTADPNWLYGAVETADYDGTIRTILATAGSGWHEMTDDDEPFGMIRYFPRLASSGELSTPTLWYRVGDFLFYLKLPLGTDNRWDYTAADYENVGFPELITSWFDADLIEVWKDWLELHLGVDIFLPTDMVTVFMQTDGDEVWNEVGTSVGTEPIRFPDNTNRTGYVRAKKIRLKFRLSGKPRLTSFFFRFITRPIPRYGWRVVLRAEDFVDLINQQQSTVTSERFAQMLYELRARGGPLRFDDGRTMSGKHNYLKNPGLEGWDPITDLPLRWSLVLGPDVLRDAQYKYKGGYSAEVTAGAGEGLVSDATESLDPGTYHVVTRLMVESGTVRVELLKDSVSVVEMIQGRTLGLGDWDGSGLDAFRRVSIAYEAETSGTYQLRITAVGDAVFRVDACELRDGEDDLSEYIAEGEPRCRPTMLGTYHDTTAFRQPFWLVYIATIAETFAEPHSVYDDDGNPRQRYGTRFSLDVREV